MRTDVSEVLLPIQQMLLDELARKPDDIARLLKESKISSQRLAGWLADPVFRGAYFVRCAHYEEMHFPAFISAIRRNAMGGGKDAPRFAKIYMDFISERSESLLAGFYRSERVSAELPEGGGDDKDEEALPIESITDLLNASSASVAGYAGEGRSSADAAPEEADAAFDWD